MNTAKGKSLPTAISITYSTRDNPANSELLIHRTREHLPLVIVKFDMYRFTGFILLITVVLGVDIHFFPILHQHSLPVTEACADSNMGESCCHLHSPAIPVNIDLTFFSPERFAEVILKDRPIAALHPPFERPPRLIS
jgi:hypothetical protein